MVFSLTVACVLVPETTFGALQLVCPPHAGDYPDEPGIVDTDTGKIARIHNQQTRAVAQYACESGVCGNSVTEPGEQCDTGGESATCDADCTVAFCGDGVVNVTRNEQCDDGNNQDGDGCSQACLNEVGAFCGNGIIDTGEECDDGNTIDNDDCTNTCSNPLCGDGIVWNQGNGTEECDDGGVPTAGCDTDCTFAICGDGITNPLAGERCDDGNTQDGDGCSANCTIKGCATDFDCASGEFCGDGSCQPKKVNGGTCEDNNECQSASCVDGYCCNSNCSNACDSCNLAGHVGSCSINPPGSEGNPSCSPYVCDGSLPVCPNSCTSNDDCAAGFGCLPLSHTCAGPAGT
jgi:cysteine-rich repeat protein